MEEVVRAFNYLIDKGLAFYWGTSMWGADEIAEAVCVAKSLGLIPPVCEQPVYNALERQKVEGEYQRICPRHGIGLTVWSPLKQGILTGKYNDAVSQPPAGSRLAEANDRFTVAQRANYGNETWHADVAKVRKLQSVADKLGVKLSQLALAFCLKNENVSTVIIGASRSAQIEENVEALKVVPKLTDEIMGEIDGLLLNKPPVEQARFGGA